MDSLFLVIKTCRNCHGKFLAESFVCKCGDCRKTKVTFGNRKKCLVSDCKSVPSFNFEGSIGALKCAKHKEDGMVNVTHPKCLYLNCKIQPTFGVRGENKRKFCSKHKEPNMIRIGNICEHKECYKTPCFNFEGEKEGRLCASHKQSNMINVKRKKCPVLGCTTTPHYNFRGESQGKFCSMHREDGMVIISSNTCENPDCGKQAGFNFEGETRRRFCFRHKLDGMINIMNKTCEYLGCKKRAHCNFDGETRGKFCSQHKEPGMNNVMNKKCSHSGCVTRPSFNVAGKRIPIFCVEHKALDMINVKDQKCEHPDCKKIPQFNTKGETHARFCSKHKENNMIDIRHKKCQCGTRAWYGIPGNQPSSCAKHKSEGMCKDPSTRCKAEDCKEHALFGTYSPIHCDDHKEKNEVNMCLRICKSCSSLEILNDEGFCFEYCINSDLYKRQKHHKEIRVQKFLQSEIKEEPYSCDKIIDSSCNKKRPDILYDCHTHFVAVEVDEHQHSSYNRSCELSRMKEICQAIGMPTIFIRYNPDNYKGSKLTKTKREQLLLEWVRFCMKERNSRDPFLQTIYLFYDGFNPSTIKPEEIPIM